MWFPARGSAVNPWKVSTFVLAAALAAVVGGNHVSSAEAAGPLRLGKALSALKASKKFLDEAKDPPAPFHQQSLVTVNQAITAVEREIKAYESSSSKDKDKEKKKDDKSDKKKDDKKKSSDSPKKKPASDNDD